MVNESSGNEDILRVMGFIGFVSILVGSAIAVFDAGLWLRTDDTYTNAMTYAMGGFTLQGMSYFFYKLLLQEGMDTKAQWTRTQRVRDRRIQDMQSHFANAQLEQELRVRQVTLERQLTLMEENPEAYAQMMGGGNVGLLSAIPFPDSTDVFNPPPEHKSESDKPISLGVDLTKTKNDGTPDKRYKSKKKVEVE